MQNTTKNKIRKTVQKIVADHSTAVLIFSQTSGAVLSEIFICDINNYSRHNNRRKYDKIS